MATRKKQPDVFDTLRALLDEVEDRVRGGTSKSRKATKKARRRAKRLIAKARR